MRAANTSLASLSSLIFLLLAFAAACHDSSLSKVSTPLADSAHSIDLKRRYGHLTHRARLRDEAHTSSIFSRQMGSDYSFEIIWGHRNLSVTIDTGSSDLWVAQSNFTCLTRGGRVTYLGYCAFGAYVANRYQGGEIEDEVFDIEYGLPFVHGTVGYEDITLAGIEVKHQEVAIADRGWWIGDNVTAGLMGLGYPTITSAWVKGSIHNESYIGRPYFPWFFSAFRRGLIPPVFSLALQRSGNNEHAGRIAFGGLPNLDFSPEFTSAPIKTYPESGRRLPPYYRVDIDGWVVDDVFHPENGTGRTHLIDSGSPSL